MCVYTITRRTLQRSKQNRLSYLLRRVFARFVKLNPFYFVASLRAPILRTNERSPKRLSPLA